MGIFNRESKGKENMKGKSVKPWRWGIRKNILKEKE